MHWILEFSFFACCVYDCLRFIKLSSELNFDVLLKSPYAHDYLFELLVDSKMCNGFGEQLIIPLAHRRSYTALIVTNVRLQFYY